MPERDPGQRLDLEVRQRRALRLRERADLILGERDVLAAARGGSSLRRARSPVVDKERWRVPAVEFA